MAKPITNLPRFRSAHTDLNDRLDDYALTKKGRDKLTPEASENLRDRSAKSLKATNAKARIAFVEALDEQLASFFRRHGEVKELFWVTVTPPSWICPHTVAQRFSPQEARRDLIKLLEGLNFFGMIDVAFYGNMAAWAKDEKTGKHNRSQLVSFHAHLLVWGRDKSYLRGLRHAHNFQIPTMPPGKQSFYFRRVSPSKAREKAIYLAKAPLKETRIQPRMKHIEVADFETGELSRVPRLAPKSWKGEIRQGDACKVHNALSRFSIPDLALSHGAGLAIMRRSIEATKRRLEREDKRQRKSVKRLLRM